MTGKQLAELVGEGCKRFVGPLLKRVEALEQRDQRIAAMEARLRRLETAHGTPDPDDGLGGA